jgi:hypothetical protein
LSKEQYQGILALLQQLEQASHSVNHTTNNFINPAGISPSIPLWILDSGATDHIFPTKNLFISLKPISPISIKLLDANYVSAHFFGKIKIGDILLQDTLYIPHFNVHLISILKLIDSIDCLAIFSKPICLIVQKVPLKTIGAAKKINVLYYLLDPSDKPSSFSSFDGSIPFSDCLNITAASGSIVTQQCNNTDSVDRSLLWHLRLGHLSNKTMKELCTKYSKMKFPDFSSCDVFHFAKQKRLSYPISITKSKKKN